MSELNFIKASQTMAEYDVISITHKKKLISQIRVYSVEYYEIICFYTISSEIWKEYYKLVNEILKEEGF